jgi:hypothetical protein
MSSIPPVSYPVNPYAPIAPVPRVEYERTPPPAIDDSEPPKPRPAPSPGSGRMLDISV